MFRSEWGIVLVMMAVREGLAGALGRRQKDEDYENIDYENDMCEVGFHMSAIVKDTWYIHGGYVKYKTGGEIIKAPNTKLRAIDLSVPFPLQSLSSAPITLSSQPSSVATLSDGALWSIGDSLFEPSGNVERINTSFPGFTSAASQQINIYDTISQTWREGRMKQSGPDVFRTRASLDTNVPSLGKSFILGGQLVNKDVSARLTVFDHATQKWTINSNTRWENRSSGTMVHVPFGEKGLLVLIGGLGDEEKLEPMEKIMIYDLNRHGGEEKEPGTWLTNAQIATAGVESDGLPAPRWHHCAVVQMAPDGSSAQIFIYGGNRHNGPVYEDVWALSLPSFEWFLVQNETTGVQRGEIPGQRLAHTCGTVGKYMMVYGGQRSSKNDNPCETTGIYALDMSSVEWIKKWDPEFAKTNYTVPLKVVAGIGGTPEGGATKPSVNPIGDEGLNKLFTNHLAAVKSASTTLTTPEYTNTPDATSLPSSEPEDKGMSTGGIAGVAVGSVLGVLAIAGLAFFFWRRRRNDNMAHARFPRDSKENQNQVPGTYYHPAELERTQKDRPMEYMQELEGHRGMPAVEMDAQQHVQSRTRK